jgi:hypothetical protein
MACRKGCIGQTAAGSNRCLVHEVHEPEWPLSSKPKYALAGTVDQVKAEFDALKRIGGEDELKWFAWFFDQGAMPWEEEMRQMELIVRHIIPAFH